MANKQSPATLLTPRARIDRDAAEEYSRSLAQIGEGWWRQLAWAHQQGIPAVMGLTLRQWAEQYHGYVKMPLESRRAAVAELAEAGLSNVAIADVLGVAEGTVRNAKRASQNYEETHAKSAADKPSENGSSQNYDPTPKAQAGAETRSRRDVSRGAPVLATPELRRGEAAIEMESIPDSSVPLILTDPPYGDQAESLYQWLAAWAVRKLLPGGSLICYTGQSRLNRDMRIFDERLRYWWLLTMRHDRSQRLPGVFVIAEFKPVLWYVREYRRGRTLINDVISSERDQTAHPWAQGSGGIAFLVENLTEPGELVVDPFAGTGRWGDITCRMGRRWTGCELIGA